MVGKDGETGYSAEDVVAVLRKEFELIENAERLAGLETSQSKAADIRLVAYQRMGSIAAFEIRRLNGNGKW